MFGIIKNRQMRTANRPETTERPRAAANILTKSEYLFSGRRHGPCLQRTSRR